jgi:ArsR family transcriptional regulator
MISRFPTSVAADEAQADVPGDSSSHKKRVSSALVKDLAQLFKLLADETRLKILDMLGRRKELCVRDIWEKLGQSQPAVSHHLGLLRMAGLVDTRHEGKHIYYRIDQQRFEELMALILKTRVGSELLASDANGAVRAHEPEEQPARSPGA